MRASICALLVAVTLLLASQAALAAGPGWRRELIPWTLVKVSHGGRVVTASFNFGGCQRNPGSSVRESRRTVWIGISVEAPYELPEVQCELVEHGRTVTIALKHPLGHRKLVGRRG